MVKIPADAIDLSDPGEPPNTLIVFLRTDRKSATFYARKTLPMSARQNPRNPYTFKNLKTIDEDIAHKGAIRWRMEIDGKIDRGEPLNPPTFTQAASHWLDWQEERTNVFGRDGKPVVTPSAHKRYKSCVNLYLIPLLGENPLTSITEETLEQYVHDRINFYVDGKGASKTHVEYVRSGRKLRRPLQTTPPAYSTLNKERVAFNHIYRHARKVMRIRIGSPPTMTIDANELTASQVRPDFTVEEWKLFKETLEGRAAEENISGEVHWYRRLLAYFCDFLFASGLRVSEAKNLNWEHLVEIDRETIDPGELSHFSEDQQFEIIDHLAQTGNLSPTEFRIRIPANLPGLKSQKHARNVIPLLNMNTVINDLFDLYVDSGPGVTKDSPLWMHKDGTRIQRFDHAFDRALKKCGLLYRDQKKRSLSSIRHTYATQRIYAGATKNGMTFLCENLGTSAEMIRDHYNHALAEIEKDTLQETREDTETLKRLMRPREPNP